MTHPPHPLPVLPHWARTVGALARSLSLVRASCSKCGALVRVDPAALVALHGPAFSLVGHRDRCVIVGCFGMMTYRVAWSYGRGWIDLSPVEPSGAISGPAEAP